MNNDTGYNNIMLDAIRMSKKKAENRLISILVFIIFSIVISLLFLRKK